MEFSHKCSVIYFLVRSQNLCQFSMNCCAQFEYYVCCGFLYFDTGSLILYIVVSSSDNLLSVCNNVCYN
jgi:hypothetical protein